MHRARESTLYNGVIKREKNSTHVTEEPKTSHLVVSRSHSPFLTFHFLLWWRPDLQPNPPKKKKSLSDCQLSWILLRSVFSLLLLLQCIVGSVVRYSKTHSVGPNIVRPSTNQPTSAVYCLCERSLGTFACCPAQKKPQSHLYIVLFLMFVCKCVKVRMRVFNNHHTMWKRKEKQDKHKFNHKQIWWAEEATSHLQSFYAMNHNRENMMRKTLQREKSYKHCLSLLS